MNQDNQEDQKNNVSFMVNGFNLLKAKQAASSSFGRSQRFITGFSCYEDARNLIEKHFGDLNDNMNRGLKIKYYGLKEQVKCEKKIGLIIYASKFKDIPDNFIGMYISNDNKQVPLYIGQICKRLISKEYISDYEMLEMCIETPNFEYYYYND